MAVKSPLEFRELNLRTLQEDLQMFLAAEPDTLAYVFSFIRVTLFTPLFIRGWLPELGCLDPCNLQLKHSSSWKIFSGDVINYNVI